MRDSHIRCDATGDYFTCENETSISWISSNRPWKTKLHRYRNNLLQGLLCLLGKSSVVRKTRLITPELRKVMLKVFLLLLNVPYWTTASVGGSKDVLPDRKTVSSRNCWNITHRIQMCYDLKCHLGYYIIDVLLTMCSSMSLNLKRNLQNVVINIT